MNLTEEIKEKIKRGAPMSLPEIIRGEIDEFKSSEAYENIRTAEDYYRNKTDVEKKENPIKQRSNVKIEHPLLKKLVDQKANYLLSKPFTVESKNKNYAKALSDFFDKGFRQKIKSLGKGAVKTGIAYLVPYLKEGEVGFMRLPAAEVIPLWTDDEHREIDGYIRFYQAAEYIAKEKHITEKVEYWDRKGVKKYKADTVGGRLHPDYDEEGNFEYPHLFINKEAKNWEKVPLVWCKYNEEELPLCYFVKTLIDDINWQTSVTADVLRDVAKFIFIIKGYGGEDFGEFVKNLRNSLAIEVESDGGVEKLEPSLNVEAVMQFLDKNRRDLFDLAANVDTKDPNLGNASGTSINFRYMDLDVDCANLGAELSETFENMKPFIDFSLQVNGKGDFSGETFEIIFNTDLPVNETEIINNINSSADLSRRTRLANHPWVKDVDAELKYIEEEKQREIKDFGGDMFSHLGGGEDEQ